ncbi:MAG: 5-formyltetrahydrofolate cyclo-ligase [Clostridiaceae bacterium]
MVKKQIRENVMKTRDNLESGVKMKYEKRITEVLTNSPLYNSAEKIFIFVAFGSEVSTMEIIEDAFNKGKKVYVPKVYSRERIMKAIQINSVRDLKPGVFGILEPESGEELIGELDLIIMPGVAFSKSGDRIGYGGGFYDKFLESIGEGVKKVAIAFSLQVLEKLPQEPFDQKVDYIITEEEVIKCNSEGK